MKRIFAIMLAGVLVLTGCGGPSGAGLSTLEGQNKGGEGMPAQTSRVLSEPVYPDFPKRPAAPEGDGLNGTPITTPITSIWTRLTRSVGREADWKRRRETF